MDQLTREERSAIEFYLEFNDVTQLPVNAFTKPCGAMGFIEAPKAPTHRPQSFTGQHDFEIARLARQGLSKSQIADAIGMSRMGVHYACKRCGIHVKRGRPGIAPGTRRKAG